MSTAYRARATRRAASEEAQKAAPVYMGGNRRHTYCDADDYEDDSGSETVDVEMEMDDEMDVSDSGRAPESDEHASNDSDEELEEEEEDLADYSDASDDDDDDAEPFTPISLSTLDFPSSSKWGVEFTIWHKGPVADALTADERLLLLEELTSLPQGPHARVVLLQEGDLLAMQKSAAREGMTVRAFVPEGQYGGPGVRQGLLFAGWQMRAVTLMLKDVKYALDKDGFTVTAARLRHASEALRQRRI